MPQHLTGLAHVAKFGCGEPTVHEPAPCTSLHIAPIFFEAGCNQCGACSETVAQARIGEEQE